MEPLSENVDTSSDNLEKYRNHSLLVAAAIATLLLFWWLLAPLYHSEAFNITATISEPSDKDYLLDCFILRDASASPAKGQYKLIESTLLESLNTTAGDRISYALFGSDTQPNPIQPPSTNKASIEAQRGLAEHTSYDTTNFALLFRRLRDTIYKDREAQAASKRRPHADAIIILSDGIPDLSSGQSACPDDTHTFLSDDILKSFSFLVNSSYATQEPIYVRLIIVGAPPLCGPRIALEWERGLSKVPGSKTFQALLFSDLGDVDGELLKRLRRQPRIIFSLAPPTNHERKRLDDEGAFSVRYSARSLLLRRPGELKIEHGILIPRREQQEGKSGKAIRKEEIVDEGLPEIRLLAVKDPNGIYSDPQSRVVVSVPPHSGQSLLGEAIRGSIYFKLENHDDKNSLSEFSKYDLRIKDASNSVVEYRPTSLSLEPCLQAQDKKSLATRIRILKIVLGIIGTVFLAGTLSWCARWKNPAKGNTIVWIQKFLVQPRLYWIGVLLVLFVPMATSMFFLQNTIEATACIVLTLSLLLHFAKKIKDVPIFSILVFTIESVSIPVLHLLAGHK